jgi:arginyl-tRNA synthetase
MNILSLLKLRFADALRDLTEDAASVSELVKPVQDPRFGDYQANIAMPLAKRLGRNPRDVAAQICSALSVADMCDEPEVAGPGFINLRLRNDWLQSLCNETADDPRLGVPVAANPLNVVVDFSSPNVAKPMHVGHLRSTVIGDALARTLRFLGHHVITDNHIGDWGTQFGMIIYGYKNFLDQQAYEQDPVKELSRLYRLVNQLGDFHDAQAHLPTAQARCFAAEESLNRFQATGQQQDKQQQKTLKKLQSEIVSAQEEVASLQKKIDSVQNQPELAQLAAAHPDIGRLSREETAKLHAGDAVNRGLWNQFLPQCLEALERIYRRLEIRFDLSLGESYYDSLLADVVNTLEQRGIAQVSEGAVCAFVPGHEAPFIIRKADGAFTYATTDLATIRYRIEELQADQILYVVDARQAEHFKLLFATSRNWGFSDVDYRHVSFGTVMGQDGRPYKTRSGDTVGLESLLDEAVQKAHEIVAAADDARTTPELGGEARERIAEMVGIGGIKYADLMHNRESDYVFDAEKMLAMTGNTATYMQYAHARIQGIFRKGELSPDDIRAQAGSIRIEHPAERTLALKLCRYAETLESVAAEMRPNLLTQYLFELANELTSFYDQCPVLKAESEPSRVSRLRLCDLAGRVIAHGLNLLGIAAPAQM